MPEQIPEGYHRQSSAPISVRNGAITGSTGTPTPANEASGSPKESSLEVLGNLHRLAYFAHGDEGRTRGKRCK